MRIFKFGGASVRDADGVKNLLKIVESCQDQPLVVVVSAMGKSTNQLEKMASLAYAGEPYAQELDSFVTIHESLSIELIGSIPDELTNWIVQLKNAFNREGLSELAFYDSVIPYGELFSTTIIYHYLKKHLNIQWVDARQYVKTNSKFTEANVEWQLTEHFISRDIPSLLQEGVVITQGFIGSDLTGKMTTLGREGSDYTGAVFAFCLDAESLTVWKDVPGLLNADPKKMNQAEMFDELSFQEVSELTYYGAKVIHPKTIRPLAQKKIPLFVRSFIDPQGAGTKISHQEKIGNKACYVFKEDQLLVSLRVLDSSFMDEKKLVKIFQAMDHANIKINLMHNSALTFTFCMDASSSKLNQLRGFLAKDFQLLYNENLSLATIKDYDQHSFALLPKFEEMIMEHKTRNTYQVVYRP
ncbi:MAG: aspartate kinase [Cyclobacteriaceae bacterium]